MPTTRSRQLFLAPALLVLVGCATVPMTGRKQLLLLSEGEETALGLQSYQEVMSKEKLSTDPAANALVAQVGARIAAATGKNYQWEFKVVDKPDTVNAFCLPGGKVVVYTGLLPVAKDEAGLATVIGHEVAHATAHHGAERMSQQMVAQLGGSAAGAAVSGKSQETQALVGQAYGVASQVGVLLPFSRKQEAEADYIGLLYMARAGYDPAAAVAFWQRFLEYNRQHGGSQGLSFLRTHPLDEQRIQDLKAELPKARGEYEKAKAAGK